MTTPHTTSQASGCRPRSPFPVVLRGLAIAGCGALLVVVAQAQYDPNTGRLKKENQRLEDARNAYDKEMARREKEAQYSRDHPNTGKSPQELLEESERASRATSNQKTQDEIIRDYAAAAERHEQEKQDQEKARAQLLYLLHTNVDEAMATVDKSIKAGDVRAALDLLYWWAEHNNPEVQWRLARAKSSGQLGPIKIDADPKEAAQWLLKAAAANHVPAQGDLAEAYAQGAGVAQDFSEALKWFRSAAIRLDPRAMIGLSRLYRQGQGAPKDPGQANLWLLRAALRGPGELKRAGTTYEELMRGFSLQDLADAFARQGAARDKGDDDYTRDDAEAFIFYALAAQLADNVRYDALRDAMAKKMTGDQLLVAYLYLGKACQAGWYSRVEGLGAQLHTAEKYVNIGVNDKAEDKWWRAAARLGSWQAAMELAYIYFDGSNGKEKNLVVAYSWAAIATAPTDVQPSIVATADSGAQSASAVTDIVPGDYRRDAVFLRNEIGGQLKKRELAHAQFLVGEYLKTRMEGEPKTQAWLGEEAVKWYTMAAENGNKEAQRRLGTAYEQGLGVAKDLGAAKEWNRIAQLTGTQWEEATEIAAGQIRAARKAEQARREQQKLAEARAARQLHEEKEAENRRVKQELEAARAQREQALHADARAAMAEVKRLLEKFDPAGYPVAWDLVCWWADRNDGEALYRMAQGKFDGHIGKPYGPTIGVGQDGNLAAELFLKAACASYGPALMEISKAFVSGTVASDGLGIALKPYLAGACNSPSACLCLNQIYEQGLGVPKDHDRANMWLVCAMSFKRSQTAAAPELIRKMPNRELAAVFGQLGAAFAQGNNGFPKYRPYAYVYYAVAAQFAGNAQYDSIRDAEGATLPPDDRQAVNDAFRKFRTYWCANILEGWGDERATEGWRMLARLDSMHAQRFLGQFFETDRNGMPADLVSAYAWHAIAAQRAERLSTEEAKYAFYGASGPLAGPTDAEMCDQIRKRLKKEDLAQAQFMVGEILGTELMPPFERKNSSPWVTVKWYMLAAENGNKKAQFRLGTAYENGLGVTKDRTLAKKWYRQSGLKQLD